ncbi:MAG: hypothetical protein D6714_05125, partial [Bacteroidetes bacterium]
CGRRPKTTEPFIFSQKQPKTRTTAKKKRAAKAKPLAARVPGMFVGRNVYRTTLTVIFGS